MCRRAGLGRLTAHEAAAAAAASAAAAGEKALVAAEQAARERGFLRWRDPLATRYAWRIREGTCRVQQGALDPARAGGPLNPRSKSGGGVPPPGDTERDAPASAGPSTGPTAIGRELAQCLDLQSPAKPSQPQSTPPKPAQAESDSPTDELTDTSSEGKGRHLAGTATATSPSQPTNANDTPARRPSALQWYKMVTL